MQSRRVSHPKTLNARTLRTQVFAHPHELRIVELIADHDAPVLVESVHLPLRRVNRVREESLRLKQPQHRGGEASVRKPRRWTDDELLQAVTICPPLATCSQQMRICLRLYHTPHALPDDHQSIINSGTIVCSPIDQSHVHRRESSRVCLSRDKAIISLFRYW